MTQLIKFIINVFEYNFKSLLHTNYCSFIVLYTYYEIKIKNFRYKSYLIYYIEEYIIGFIYNIFYALF